MHLYSEKMKEKIICFIKRYRWLVFLIKSCQGFLGLILRKPFVECYFKKHSDRKLQIGAFTNILEGWLNTDIHPQSLKSVTLDATKKFPFPDQAFSYIFSEHQLEHIAYDKGFFMLKECFRILKPGGKIRIAMPSLDRLLQLYNPNLNPLQKRYIEVVNNNCYPGEDKNNPCFTMNAAYVHWGHLFLYDEKTIQAALEKAGFTNASFYEPGISDDPALTGIEGRLSDTDKYETLVVEATRPFE